MSIKTLVEDAEMLWLQNRKQGAWTLALIAAAATARKRYPRPTPDNKAFKSFICDIAKTIVSGDPAQTGPMHFRFYDEDPNVFRTLEDILYEELRCNLVHEGELRDVTFSESVAKTTPGGVLYEGSLSVPPKGPAVIPDFWVLHLIKAIKAAPENGDLFGDAR